MTVDRPHQPQRPLWLCRNCAQPWPCGRARVTLIREYAEARTVLRVYLASCMHEAIADLVRLNPDTAPSPADFWRRFLAWATPRPDRE